MKSNIYFKFLIASILLFVVLYNVVLWFYLFSVYTGSFNQLKNEYLQHFPAFLQNAKLITLIDIGFCGIAALLYRKVYSFPQQGGLRILSFILFLFSLLLIAWLLFTLM